MAWMRVLCIGGMLISSVFVQGCRSTESAQSEASYQASPSQSPTLPEFQFLLSPRITQEGTGKIITSALILPVYFELNGSPLPGQEWANEPPPLVYISHPTVFRGNNAVKIVSPALSIQNERAYGSWLQGFVIIAPESRPHFVGRGSIDWRGCAEKGAGACPAEGALSVVVSPLRGAEPRLKEELMREKAKPEELMIEGMQGEPAEIILKMSMEERNRIKAFFSSLASATK